MAEANPRTFDLFDPSEDVTQAEAIVKLPRDRQSLFSLSKVEEQISKTANADEVVKLEEKVAELKAKIAKSELRVTLRGIDKIMLGVFDNAIHTGCVFGNLNQVRLEVREMVWVFHNLSRGGGQKGFHFHAPNV